MPVSVVAGVLGGCCFLILLLGGSFNEEKLFLLFFLILCAATAYLTYNTYGNWSFAFALRGRRIFAFALVAIAISFSTITLQTVTSNRYLTPGILGLDQLYVLVQTLCFFYRRDPDAKPRNSSDVLILCQSDCHSRKFIDRFFYQKAVNGLFLLLMAGMVCGTMFSSLSTFLQVLMDPNEYDLLQGRLFASFGNINTQHLLIAAVIILIGSSCLILLIPELNLLHLEAGKPKV